MTARDLRVPAALTLALAGVVTVAGHAAPPAAPAATAPTLAEAERMIDACFALAAAEKMPALSVVVVDGGGVLIAFRRQDGANTISVEAALLKARTAQRSAMASSALGGVAAQDPALRDSIAALGLIDVGGGVPLPNGLHGPVGAVGVSGAAPAQDERCAIAAAQVLSAPQH